MHACMTWKISAPLAMVLSMYSRVLREWNSAKRSRLVPSGRTTTSFDTQREADAHYNGDENDKIPLKSFIATYDGV